MEEEEEEQAKLLDYRCTRDSHLSLLPNRLLRPEELELATGTLPGRCSRLEHSQIELSEVEHPHSRHHPFQLLVGEEERGTSRFSFWWEGHHRDRGRNLARVRLERNELELLR